MNQLNLPHKIAFMSSYPPKMYGVTVFTSRLVETMTLSPNPRIEPFIIVLQSDVSETYCGNVDFVIHKGVPSDYMEAADLINTGNIGRVELELEYQMLGGERGLGIDLLLRRISAPIVTTLLYIPENPSPLYFQRLTDVCDASWKIIATNQEGVDLLKKTYKVSGHKIERLAQDIPQIPPHDVERWEGTTAGFPYEEHRKRYPCNGFY